MKIEEHQIENKKVIQIYLRQHEKDSIEVKNKIKEMQNRKIKVVLFISGDNEAENVIKDLVKTMKLNSLQS